MLITIITRQTLVTTKECYTSNTMQLDTETNEIATESNRNLIDILEKLESQIKRQNSLKYAFIRGMFYGLGTVIGATVLVALFGGIIVAVVNTFTDQPISTSSFGQMLKD